MEAGPDKFACRTAWRDLDGFLDGDLTDSETEDLKRHLAACPDCRKELSHRRRARARGPAPAPVPGSDWMARVEQRLARKGPMEEVLRAMFLPWEKKIPLWSAAVVLAAVVVLVMTQVGCDGGSCPVAPSGSGEAAAAPTAPPATPPAAAHPRLRSAPSGGVLIIEEPEGGPSSGGPPPEMVFQDHFVTLTSSDPGTALVAVENTVGELGGQLIGYPITGFENVEENERVVVFDLGGYKDFLDRLKTLGELTYEPVKNSEFVTAKVTVVPEQR
ncbi:MAG TPA: zf-HC2 domain-containing protein [bacterium]|nr:zf-HC2 domain-containing protein [bacterium]HPQ66360.1 zf-HC2 domain-containing protein [bacterium]